LAIDDARRALWRWVISANCPDCANTCTVAIHHPGIDDMMSFENIHFQGFWGPHDVDLKPKPLKFCHFNL
jgi:hypothetical protein